MENKAAMTERDPKPQRKNFETGKQWLDAVFAWCNKYTPEPSTEQLAEALHKFEEEEKYKEWLKSQGIVDSNILPVR